MSKNTKPVKQTKIVNNKETKTYKNPSETLWGKIIIWFLLIGMVGTVIVGLIIALINALK